MVDEMRSALTALIVVVYSFQALNLDFGNETGAAASASELVEAVLRVVFSLSPDLVVPAVVDVLVHCEEVSPGGIVIRTLEYDLINVKSLVLQIFHEPLYLSQHADMLSLEAESDKTGAINLIAFHGLSD